LWLLQKQIGKETMMKNKLLYALTAFTLSAFTITESSAYWCSDCCICEENTSCADIKPGSWCPLYNVSQNGNFGAGSACAGATKWESCQDYCNNDFPTAKKPNPPAGQCNAPEMDAVRKPIGQAFQQSTGKAAGGLTAKTAPKLKK
jgi:hypothetical protein